jgi:hypothetical protein
MFLFVLKVWLWKRRYLIHAFSLIIKRWKSQIIEQSFEARKNKNPELFERDIDICWMEFFAY